MPENTALRSIADGVVERVVDFGNTNIGKGVMIRHDDGTVAIYGHLNEVDVKPGQHVDAGDVIGLSGNTGHSTGPHLHFGLMDAQGNFIDPTPISEKVADMQGSFLDWLIQRGRVGTFEHADSSVWAWLANSVWTDFKIWLTSVMPEIGAVTTIICAVMLMFTGNVPRWIGVWGISMGGAIIWLIST
jgi:hypothetical protein